MKKIFQILFLIGILFSFSECTEGTKVAEKQLSFFDLKGYFLNQKVSLSKIEKFKKSTFIDGKQIEKEIDSIDFDEELIVFEESDINKVAWLDRYWVDSIYENGLLNRIVYNAADDKLRTQQMLISFNQNEVDTIRIFNNSSSNVAKLEQRLLYVPAYGYSIESKQKTVISAEHVVAVVVQFLK